MPKIDGRTLDHDTLEHMRLLAVQRVIAGEKPSEVASSLGFYRTSIYRWIRAHKRGGQAALSKRIHPGPKRKLTDKQEAKVVRWMVGKDPRQYGFEFGLWTRQIVQTMIQERFHVSLTLPAIGHLLTRLDITPQKPLRRAYERDEIAVTDWKARKYPELRKRARARGAVIFFLDEAGVRSDSPLGRSYGLKGHTPIVKTSGQRQKISAISAVTPKGGFWFKVYSGMLTAVVFVSFLKDFMKGRRNPVMLVVDGLSVHKAKCVQEYVKATEGKLELHFLPPYAPDLNPDEFVWNHLKQNGTSKKPLRKNESLRERVQADLTTIKQDSKLVRSFFNAESVSYTVT